MVAGSIAAGSDGRVMGRNETIEGFGDKDKTASERVGGDLITAVREMYGFCNRKLGRGKPIR